MLINLQSRQWRIYVFGGPDALTAVGAPQSLTVGQQTRCRVFNGFISQLSGYIYFSQAWLTT